MHRYFINGRIFTGEVILDDHCVEVHDGLIRRIMPQAEIIDGVETIDLGGHLLAPGFIDVQVNGGGGVLFNDEPSVETLETMIHAHRRFGTTSLLPTLISDKWDVMQLAANAIRQGMKEEVRGLQGVHFEGPYLNPARKGIHQEDHLREVDEGALALLNSEGLGVVVTTLAPERVSGEYIRALAEGGVRVCAGHTEATYEEAMEGVRFGVTGFTHLFNAMSPMTSREPGVVGAALDDPASWVGIIADGHHIHYASLRVAVAAKKRGKMMLVTDAMPSVGAADKNFVLQGQPIIGGDGRCVSEEGTLAGSDLDMAGAVRNTVEHLGLSLEEALRMASLYPAGFLGLDERLGRIEVGYEADFVLLNESIEVKGTWIGGDAS